MKNQEKVRNLHYVYIFVEKETEKVIYVGSTSRLSPRLKEHRECCEGKRKGTQYQKIHQYMNTNHLILFEDVEVRLVSQVDGREEAMKRESELYYQYKETLLNDRPGENKFGKYNPKRSPVYCFNNNTIYETIEEAGRNMPFSPQTISRVVNGEKEFHTYDGEDYYFARL